MIWSLKQGLGWLGGIVVGWTQAVMGSNPSQVAVMCWLLGCGEIHQLDIGPTTSVNSAFYPSGVGKWNISLPGWRQGRARSLVPNGRWQTLWSHMARDALQLLRFREELYSMHIFLRSSSCSLDECRMATRGCLVSDQDICTAACNRLWVFYWPAVTRTHGHLLLCIFMMCCSVLWQCVEGYVTEFYNMMRWWHGVVVSALCQSEPGLVTG